MVYLQPCDNLSQNADTLQQQSNEMASAAFREARSRQIFMMELEFVQCLSNPDYLQWLAKNNYFEQPEFINYLKYLQYWKRTEYAAHLLFPQCLRILDALTDPDFRKKLFLNEAILELKRQQSHQWIYYDRTYEDVCKYFHYQI